MSKQITRRENTEEALSSFESAKDLLLADLEYFGNALQRNEESGETRVNFFITLLAAIPVAIVGLSEHNNINFLENTLARNMLLIFLFPMLMFGLFIFLRLVKRNRITDEFKFRLDWIRQQYKDIYDPISLLSHKMSASDKNPMALVNTSTRGSETSQKSVASTKTLRGKLASFFRLDPYISEKTTRGRGSLAHLVSLINSANLAVISVLILSDIGPLTFVIAIGGFFLALLVHEQYINWTEITTKAVIKGRRFTHAGGIIFRKKRVAENSDEQELEYLVTTNKQEKQEKEGMNYLFPKGHIELGEELSQAALREVFEETGVVGRIVRPIGSYVSNVEGNYQRVRFYLIECLDEATPHEDREKYWLNFRQAGEKLSYVESKNMLLHAHSFLLTGSGDYSV